MPSRNGSVTPTCTVCGSSLPAGRPRVTCSDGCRQKAWRLRHQPEVTVPGLPAARSRRDHTVYQCPDCEARQVGVFSSPASRETITSARSAKSCKGFWGWRRKLDVGYRCITRKPMTTDGRTAAEVVIMLAGDPRLVQARRSRDGARWG